MKITNSNIELLPSMANRHGLITGSTGTGKTVTLRVMAEGFSKIGVPVFMSDVKGDLSGLIMPGYGLESRATAFNLPFEHKGYPVFFWDVLGENGHPIRTTLGNLSPLLVARLLELNAVQTGVITLAYKVYDDYLKNSQHNVFLNFDDLKALLKHLADNAHDYTTDYGNINYTSVGAIQRAILEMQAQDVDRFLNMPVFDIFDFIVTDQYKSGIIHILEARHLINSPKLYTTFLLWLLSELYDKLPERGDQEKPLFIFFFDEAHLLFNDINKILLKKIELIIRLIRSKGVGIYFISQSSLDIPKTVGAQLGNRVQHALRAFTPEDYSAIRKIARTFRVGNFNIEEALTTMGTGEALVSFLQEDGSPSVVERVFIAPPESQIEPLTDEEKQLFIKASPMYGKYEKELYGPRPRLASNNDNRANKFIEQFGRGIVRAAGNQVGREIIRGFFNTFIRGVRSGIGK